MNILIADDHALFLDTLNHYIHRAQPDYRLQTVASLGEVVEILMAKKFNPDLCILDYRMPGMKGYEGFQNLLRAYPDQLFAVMSGVAEPEDIDRILSLKVAGFLPKTLPGRLMLKAIDSMLQGKKYIPYAPNTDIAMPTYFADHMAPVPTSAPQHAAGRDIRLTAREKEVLSLLCQGKSNKAIAYELSLQVVTVKLHVRGIFKKLQCGNRTLAALKARELGVLN